MHGFAFCPKQDSGAIIRFSTWLTDEALSPAWYCKKRYFSLFSLLVAFTLCSPAMSQVDSQANREYHLKVAFLLQFGRYTQWPATIWQSPEEPFIIGIVGPNPFPSAVTKAADDRTIQNRPVDIKYFDKLSEFSECHILFVSGSLNEEAQNYLIRHFKGEPILLVGDDISFAKSGGDIGFFVKANRLRMAINLESVKDSQLKISSKLLNLAQIVDPAIK
jgi:YfiR/HmsC-like